MIIQILFWLSVFALFHSYLLYPFLLQLLARKRRHQEHSYTRSDKLPLLSIIIPAYNEESVIEKKLGSILNSNYPSDCLEIMVASDASTDSTNDILDKIASGSELVKMFFFNTRQGKGNIINQLVPQAKGEVIIITDANVIFSDDTLFELARYFKDPGVGLVDSNMKHSGIQLNGISIQENVYISREVKIKYREGLLWGAMMGPFGGCFAVKRELFAPIPANFLVDDFYLNMKIMEAGYKAISNLESIVYEDVSNNLMAEFRRKTRIATGDFQNLFHFSGMLWPLFTGKAFAFLSHKVLRWNGPFFLILAFVFSGILFNSLLIYRLAFVFQCILILAPVLDFFLRKIGVHIIFLRFLTHFYTMNLAMLTGFLKYIKGVKSNVWQPTQRYQSR